MLNKLFDFFGRRQSVEQDLAAALRSATVALREALQREEMRKADWPTKPGVEFSLNGLSYKTAADLAREVERARVRAGLPPRRNPTAPRQENLDSAVARAILSNLEPPVRKAEHCQADESCGFPLHLPPTMQGGPSYPPHMAVKISGDTTECMDCGLGWNTGDPDYPETCTPLDPMKHMHEAGWTDFPFAKRPEVTSDIEHIARKLFANATAFKYQDETQYEVSLYHTVQVVNRCREWMHTTPFIANDQGPVQELERIVAKGVEKAEHSRAGMMEFAQDLIHWCERNPLD